MTYNEIIQRLEKKIFDPVYLLMGEENYFIDKISDYIAKNALPEAEKGFNQTIFYGKDTDADTILTTVRRFPMMSAFQVVILREAQALKGIEDSLLPYIENPLSSTIFVICYKYGTMDKRKKFTKVAAQKGVLFESKKIYENQVVSWIQNYCKDNNYQIVPQASLMLAEYLGTEISKVANELDKLMILLPDGSTIRPIDIEKNIGISKDFNVFELQNALGSRDIVKANRIINYFGSNSNLNPIQKTVAALNSYFYKLLKYQLMPNKSNDAVSRALGVPAFFINQYKQAAKAYSTKKIVEIISLLREFDMKSKGVGNVSVPQSELQKELIYKILH